MVEVITLNGHRALKLENGRLRIVVLPQKGADIYELTHLPSGVQFLMHTPWGLKPPSPQPPTDFLENYEGGWQVLFPNINDPCEYRGRQIPFHGEAALLAWQDEVVLATEQEVRLRLWVTCQLTPFRLERELTLRQGEPVLELTERVTNLDRQGWDFVWCQHLVLGGNFIEDGCRIELPARRITTPLVLYEPQTARLAEGQDSSWPYAIGRDGSPIDLQQIPGPEAHSHDDAMLWELERGEYCVHNPRLNLSFKVEWEKEIYPYVMFWMPYGGAELAPLTGVYGVGLEPTSAPYPLAQAVAAGLARSLGGGESLQTRLTIRVLEG